MNTLLNHLRTQSTAPLAHTFIIGAGDGSQLTHWRELSSEQLHLAEAHPAHAKTLQQHTQGQPQEHLYPGAITADTQETATLHLLTLPKFSSLNAPSGLSQQLPNISVQGTETVPAQPITAWLTQTELDPNATHTLVINAPGQAHALLNATPNALLHAFTWIMVSTADEALYENDVDSATLETALTQRGYARVAEDDATYPTVERLYQRQPSVIERLTLTAERDALAKQLEEARATAKSETEKLAKELEQARNTAKQHEEACVIARRETTKQSQALEATQSQLAERDQQLEEARNTAKQHEEACATAKSEAEKLAKELEQARNTAKQHEEACVIARSEATKQSQALKDAEAARATAKSEAEKLAKELEEARVIARSEATKQSQALEATQKQLAERDQQLEEARNTAKQHEEARVIARSEATKQSQALEAAQHQLAERDQLLEEARNTAKQHEEACATAKSEAEKLAKELEESRVIARSEATKQSQALEAAQKQLAERDQQLEEARNTAKQHEEACVIARRETTKQSQALEATQKQLAERDQQLEEARNTAKQHEEACATAKSETEKLAKELEQARNAAKQHEEACVIARRETTKQSQALEAAQSQLAERDQQLEEAKQQIETLTQQLATKENSLTKTEERFSSLESKLDQLFGEQRSYIQQTTNALGQHVTRSAQQQRDEQALTHYLHHGQRPISTELPPNFAMALLERRETQRYDVMVVLGSTPITELLAQAVVNETRQQPRLTAQHANESGKDVQHYVAPSQDDLPQAVISLAHKKSLCKTLKQRLAANHTQEAVNVVHAPWVEANEKGDLFYAWEATLKRLNQWLEEEAKVLVVVGNALAEANHPRMAALPQLLQHLPTQTLEVIVEGNHYPQESDLKAEWEALLSKREREAETLRLPSALGIRVSG
jgi:hypothetical protein